MFLRRARATRVAVAMDKAAISILMIKMKLIYMNVWDISVAIR